LKSLIFNLGFLNIRKKEIVMEKRKIGNSGIEVNPLGLGCMRISAPCTWLDGKVQDFNAPDQNTAVKLLHKAVDMGIDLFDTANAYGAGQNEETLGKAFSGLRDKVKIVSKFGHIIDETTRTLCLTGYTPTPKSFVKSKMFPAMIKWQCEQSLRRLKTDYLDVFLCHIQVAENGEEMMGALEELVKQGKIRSYGWSTDLADRAEIFAKGENCSAIELKINVVENKNDTLAVCDNNNLAAFIRGPLGGGVLGKTGQNSILNDVREILTSEGRSVVQGALCWLWAKSENAIPIPGFRTMEQLEGLCGTLEYEPLTQNQMSEIEVIMNK